MTVDFSIMEQHLTEPRMPSRVGKLVLSRLRPGSSMIGAASPSVKLVVEGEEIYEVDGRTYRVRPGQFLYLDAGSACTGTNRGDTTGICLMMAREDDEAPLMDEADPVLGRALVLSTHCSAFGRTIADYARRIAREPRLGPALAGELVAAVGAAVREPLGESREAIDRLKVAKASTRRDLFQRLERARGHLHAHPDRNVALAELASVAGLSQFHLARFFKLAFGQAPIAYHRALRLGRAAELLAAGGLTLAHVAEATGYSDQVSLSHAFRKHYGRAPQHWALERRAS